MLVLDNHVNRGLWVASELGLDVTNAAIDSIAAFDTWLPWFYGNVLLSNLKHLPSNSPLINNLLEPIETTFGSFDQARETHQILWAEEHAPEEIKLLLPSFIDYNNPASPCYLFPDDYRPKDITWVQSSFFFKENAVRTYYQQHRAAQSSVNKFTYVCRSHLDGFLDGSRFGISDTEFVLIKDY